MQFSPLNHGGSGIFDEVILVVEGVLALALIYSFLKSRGRGKPKQPAGLTEKHADNSTRS
ncbi:MAG: hypothetical protein HYR71_12590 [Chloroflexi bacterium]|nr:hypothetical protein [Chloroflexota bacterium]